MFSLPTQPADAALADEIRGSTDHMRLSPDDPIDMLGLSIRPRNALERAHIHTIGQLLQAREGDLILLVRNFGVASLAEVEECLAQVELDIPPAQAPMFGGPGCGSVAGEERTSKAGKGGGDNALWGVLRWQRDVIRKSISLGLLHSEAKVSGRTIGHWLSARDDTAEADGLFSIYATILGAGLNICEEVAYLFEVCTRNRASDNCLAVLLLRYGYPKKTLEEVGQQLGVTRERVRQIGRCLETCFAALIDLQLRPMLRIQSALLLAQDIGFDITYSHWALEITSSGLLGKWPEQCELLGEPLDVMLATCRAVGQTIAELQLPENLALAVEFASDGKPDSPASLLHIRKGVSKALRKLIRRHAQFSGAVSAPWLAEESGTEITVIRNTLWAFGYREISDGWYLPPHQGAVLRLHKNHVFHHAVRKMAQFCGPLPLDELCSGLRHTARRTQFPIPRAEVLAEVLSQSGSVESEGLWRWDGEADESLSSGEKVILACIQSCGPVAHHAELAQAFIESHLSFPSLHATLHSSPLFKRMAPALYSLRGTSPSGADIDRAEAAGSRIPLAVEVKYTRTGHIEIELSLGIIAVGTGVVVSEQLPDLSGEWDCQAGGVYLDKIDATSSELRRLLRAFSQLGCQVGDRVRFVFNTWNRTVTIVKINESTP